MADSAAPDPGDRWVIQTVGRLFGLVGLVPHRRPPFVTKGPKRTWRAERRYRVPVRRGQAHLMGRDLSAFVTWRARPDPQAPQGELQAIFASTPHLHKWLHYLPIYERTLARFRGGPLLLLEIGVDRGGSLRAWKEYFGPQATVVGVDINPDCREADDAEAGIHIRIGAQQDKEFLGRVVEEFGPFDVIIDDGSHFTSHLIASFQFLFTHGMRPGGVYLAEDLQTNYWRSYRDSRHSFVDLAKALVETMYSPYIGNDMLEPRFRIGSPDRIQKVTVPLAATIVESVEFDDGIVVVRRAPENRDLPGSYRT